MTAGTASRTAHLLAVMNKGHDLRPGPPGHRRDQPPARCPGLVPRLLSRSLAAGADHATCVTPAHPVRHQASGKGHSATEQMSQGG